MFIFFYFNLFLSFFSLFILYNIESLEFKKLWNVVKRLQPFRVTIKHVMTALTHGETCTFWAQNILTNPPRMCSICLEHKKCVESLIPDSTPPCTHLYCSNCRIRMMEIYARSGSDDLLECVACRLAQININRPGVPQAAQYLIDPIFFRIISNFNGVTKKRHLSLFATTVVGPRDPVLQIGGTMLIDTTHACSFCHNKLIGPFSLDAQNIGRCSSLMCYHTVCILCQEIHPKHTTMQCPMTKMIYHVFYIFYFIHFSHFV